jgi:hypothetical protein
MNSTCKSITDKDEDADNAKYEKKMQIPKRKVVKITKVKRNIKLIKCKAPHKN